MTCPLCSKNDTEKIVFHNGRKFRHYAVTAISYFCLTAYCTHRATVLISNYSKKSKFEAENLACEYYKKEIETR